MKNIKTVFSVLVFTLIATMAFAQPTDLKKQYQDSLKQVELKRKTDLANEYQAKLSIINDYSSAIDIAIQNKDLVEHRLNMNATNKVVVGSGQYNRNVYFYYEPTGHELKKVIVFTIFNGDQRDYQEFVFNENGMVYKVQHLPDMSNAKTAKAFYYEDEKLSLYTKDGGKVFGADDVSSFDEDAFQESVEWLNRSAGYVALFKLMKSVEPANK